MGDTKLDARDERLLDDLREGSYRGDVLPRDEARDILAAYRKEIVRETEGNDYSAQDIESERDALKAEVARLRAELKLAQDQTRWAEQELAQVRSKWVAE